MWRSSCLPRACEKERERGVSNGVDTEAGPGRSIIATKRSFIASDKVDRQRLGTVPPRNHELTPLPLSFLAVQKGPAASWQEVESYLIYHTLLVARKFFPTLFIRSRLYLTRHVYRQLFSLSRREKLEEETRYPVYRRLRTGRDLRGELSPSLFQREREEKEEKERLPTGRPPFFLAARKPWLRFVPRSIFPRERQFSGAKPLLPLSTATVEKTDRPSPTIALRKRYESPRGRRRRRSG